VGGADKWSNHVDIAAASFEIPCGNDSALMMALVSVFQFNCTVDAGPRLVAVTLTKRVLPAHNSTVLGETSSGPCAKAANGKKNIKQGQSVDIQAHINTRHENRVFERAVTCNRRQLGEDRALDPFLPIRSVSQSSESTFASDHEYYGQEIQRHS
jgi:hypothetical protein